MTQASDVDRSFHFLVSTSLLLMGLFVNSHATGRVGDDDWEQGSGGRFRGRYASNNRHYKIVCSLFHFTGSAKRSKCVIIDPAVVTEIMCLWHQGEG